MSVRWLDISGNRRRRGLGGREGEAKIPQMIGCVTSTFLFSQAVYVSFLQVIHMSKTIFYTAEARRDNVI